MKFKLVLVFKLSVLASTFAQYPINGTCPSFDQCRELSPDVSPQKSAGVWYLYASIPYVFQSGFKCTFDNLTLIEGANFYQIIRSERDVKTNEERITNGTLKFTADGLIHLDYTYCNLRCNKVQTKL